MRRAITGWVVLMLALVLSGCGRNQPDFGERYETARQQLEASATAIDHDIAASASASDAAAATTDQTHKSGG